MKVEANISLGAVARAMGSADLEGAKIRDVRVTVAFHRDGLTRLATFARKGGDRLIVQHAEVNAEEAFDAMSDEERSRLDLDDGDDLPAVDDGDLHDFMIACLAGDRAAALALAPRLFDHSNLATVDAALVYSSRRRA